MPATESLADANLRSPSYYVAQTHAACRDCGLSTRLLALALPRTHETLEDCPPAVEAESDGVATDGVATDGVATDGAAPGESATDSWQLADVDAFLFYVQQLPDGVQRQLRQISPGYRPARSAATQSVYWVNHCEHCGALLDDYELHCEPEGAFMPCSEAEAGKIHLMQILEPIQALAAGYSPDPLFFGLMPAS
jgi:hypothetical protein